jgi:hypothetical protein
MYRSSDSRQRGLTDCIAQRIVRTMTGTRHIDHKGQIFSVTELDTDFWKVTDAAGRNYGTLIVVAAEGEEREPVFGVVRPADHEPYMQGSDADELVRALINQVETT